MKKNKVITSTIGIALLSYLILHALEFRIQINSPYWSVFAKFGLGLLLVFLPLSLKAKWIVRITFSILMGISLMLLIPKLRIWNISLNHYVKNNHINYENYIDQHEKELARKIEYVSCREGVLMTKPKLEETNLNSTICRTFEELDVSEVFINQSNSKYLFAMHRFIDNGYGLLYSTANFNKSEFYEERVNGLQLTSIHKIDSKWYYVTFT